jgi:hypothetical protein
MFDPVVAVGHAFSGSRNSIAVRGRVPHPVFVDPRRNRRAVAQVGIAKTTERVDATRWPAQLGQHRVQLPPQDARLVKRLIAPRSKKQAGLPVTNELPQPRVHRRMKVHFPLSALRKSCRWAPQAFSTILMVEQSGEMLLIFLVRLLVKRNNHNRQPDQPSRFAKNQRCSCQRKYHRLQMANASPAAVGPSLRGSVAVE